MASRDCKRIQNMPKPDGMSDADFTKLHNESAAIFDGAVGFAALQAKDYANGAEGSSRSRVRRAPA